MNVLRFRPRAIAQDCLCAAWLLRTKLHQLTGSVAFANLGLSLLDVLCSAAALRVHCPQLVHQ